MDEIEQATAGIEVFDRSNDIDPAMQMRRDVFRGLNSEQKELPPKYFYDRKGSILFEKITELDEYYQTRTERDLIESVAGTLASDYAFTDLIELGSGSSVKTRVLLDALTGEGELLRYHPIDVSRAFLVETAEDLEHDYPELAIRPVVGDFNDGLQGIERGNASLTIFLGGTIGNLYHHDALYLLREISGEMTDDDRFLLGIDLVKDPALLHAAYNDSSGITEAFNLNILHVLNRSLGANFDPDSFYHYAFYNPVDTRIEMHLISRRDQSVRIDELEMEVTFDEGESIRTEISRKFTRASVSRLLAEAGLELESFWTDRENLFGLLLARPT